MKLLSLLFVVSFSLVSFTPAPTQEKGFYSILVVDGSKNGTGYASKIIYYPGYSNCKRYSSSQYSTEATRGYVSYLRANFNNALSNVLANDIRVIDTRQYSTSELLLTREQAQQRLTQWAAEQKDKGYQVVYSNFTFSCNNL